MKNKKIIGLEYIFNTLELITPIGYKKLKKLEFLTDEKEIKKEINATKEVFEFYMKNKKKVSEICHSLMKVRDITTTIKRLKNEYILDDVELFEIKTFSIISEELRELIKNEISIISLDSLNEVVEILDPEGYKIPSFYICDEYSEELKNLRKKKSKASEEEKEKLYEIEVELEDEIREKLTKQLIKYSKNLESCINKIAYLDLLIAKAKQIEKLDLCEPEISEETEYKSFFNPEIKDILEKKGKRYQKINVNVKTGVNIITGANMSGKTVILKTLALCQYMFQMGFFIPAESAKIRPVKKVFLQTGDYQSSLSGLSSYASEMIQLNEALTYSKKEKSCLILLDELARSTNPHEGKAIVKAVIRYLNSNDSLTYIATHYNVTKNENVRKLRVKGLIKEKLNESIDHKRIDEYIDYALIEDEEDKIPEEALTIAKLLNIDNELIDIAEKILKKEGLDEE
ncbi:endonuclease MutS2 [Tepiditoga spiralis]|uniref:Endonuclease MutS2 n=1 Tax=Tepiditoga spiralis TaxID=2108365 RepID=A0A7G1G8Q0_9BACT|nr:DNA mismatch repair protein MutS [Tepiditoga spiralis]BBE30422.1 endonuclease MutS2 [Tepiditoga spiralis]